MEPRDLAKSLLAEGRAAAARQDLPGAVAAYRRAIDADPAFAVPHNALGVALGRLGDVAGSEAALEAATRLNAKWADPWVNLAGLRRRREDKPGAAAAWLAASNRGFQLPVGEAEWLGLYLATQERYAPSVPFLQRACDEKGDRAELWYALGVALQRTHDLDGAERAFRRALQMNPGYAEAWNNLGNLLKSQVRFDEAVQAYEAGIAARPDKANTWRNRLFSLQYDPARTVADIGAAHRAYGDRFVDPLPPPELDRRSGRPLRVGFVSADFGSHPVGYFLAPVFTHYDRTKLHVIAYAGPRPEDDLTRRLRASCDAWVPTGKLDDDALIARIQRDRVDVLVDLGGHTRGSRIQVFARKPAPVQVTWAGYVGTTGLSTIDWILGDHRHTPEGYEAHCAERVWRMPRTYVCWEPPDAPPVGPLPMLTPGRGPTIGSFNNLPKINRGVVALWARVLRARPDARLKMVTKSLGDPVMQARWRAWFAEEGVSADRIDMSGRVSRDELLAMYANEVDLVLDPTPYSGGLTTLEALWMGVPSLTLGGDRFSARHTLGHQGAAGLDGFLARDADDYVRIALEWLGAPRQLAAVRLGLRERVRHSALCDGVGFTRELEDALLGMWAERLAR